MQTPCAIPTVTFQPPPRHTGLQKLAAGSRRVARPPGRFPRVVAAALDALRCAVLAAELRVGLLDT
eukprot:11199595-Lingulodinium_polyedra.AAC.1